MSYRVHTANPAHVQVQWGTAEGIDRELAYEHTEIERNQFHLVLNDHGNDEAWVMRAETAEDREALARLASNILEYLEDL